MYEGNDWFAWICCWLLSGSGLGFCIKICSGLNRLCPLPPTAQRPPPSGATSRSDRGEGAGSNSFQSDYHGAQFGCCHGKLHRLPNPCFSGRHSQWHRNTEMQSRIHQSGLHCGWGSASDRPAARECGADCVELRGGRRDLRGRTRGLWSGTMLLPLLPVQMLPERPGSRFLLSPRLSSVCSRDLVCTLFLCPH